ncbi:TPA: glycosyltransferase family 2 protein [Kluyvera cryocrescens]
MNRSEVICVIVTFNREFLLQKTLDSVLEQTFKIKKVIIIDNNSSDNTYDIVRTLQNTHPIIEYHNTGANLGGAGGFYHGFKLASKYDYDYLWLMDDDLRPECECLEKLIDAADEDGIYQPVRFNLDGSCAELSPIIYDLRNPFFMNPKRLSVLGLFKTSTINKPFNIQGIPFEGPLISKKIVDNIGLPNPDFFIFYDDLDYSLRARNAGFKIMCIPDARAVRLLQNNQSNDLISWKGYFMLRNLFYIHRVYGENILVKIKPFILAFGYLGVSLCRFNFKQASIVFSAICDSGSLKNSDLHKPK